MILSFTVTKDQNAIQMEKNKVQYTFCGFVSLRLDRLLLLSVSTVTHFPYHSASTLLEYNLALQSVSLLLP